MVRFGHCVFESHHKVSQLTERTTLLVDFYHDCANPLPLPLLGASIAAFGASPPRKYNA